MEKSLNRRPLKKQN